MSNVDPRIAPKEMILTRNKSAQQRRQLRDKDRSMTKLTQLLKSPSRAKKKTVKSHGEKTKTQKTPSSENTEYYPDKLRRKFEEKRVFLRPLYSSKTVGKMNKRKRGMPQRNFGDTNSPKPRTASPVFAELTMEELVRFVEETEPLDDEDLMEILTCPSPVWWEAPPDENYVEEAICKRKPPDTKKQKKTKKEETTKKVTNESSKQKDKMAETMKGVNVPKNNNFKRKHSKLENLLGNIKSKAKTKKSSENNIETLVVERKNNVRTYKNKSRTADKLDANGNRMTDGNIEIPTKSSDKMTEGVNEKATKSSDKMTEGVNEKATKSTDAMTKGVAEIATKSTDAMIEGDIAIKNNTVERRKNTCSESNESDADPGLNEDALLIDLENMDIPMENNINKQHAKVKIDSNLELTESEVNALEVKVTEESPLSDISSPTDVNLSPAVKRPRIEELQSPSGTSYSDKSDVSSGHDNCDTISDTNIKFIADEDIDDDCNPINDVKGTTIDKESAHMDKITAKGGTLDELNENDFVTVYQIVQSDKEKIASKFKNIPEYSTYVQKLMNHETQDDSSKYDGQLNSFFKKCKNANRKRKREVESKAEVKKTESQLCDCDPKNTTISIAQDDNVKYCLNCSSIFDTDECSYCLNTKSDNDTQMQMATNMT